MLSQDLIRSLEPWRWPSVPATILASALREDFKNEKPYGIEVTFQYEWLGKEHISERLGLSRRAYADAARARRVVGDFQAGARVRCFVNPQDPSVAILVRENPAIIFLLLFPMLFVAIGGWGLAWVTGLLPSRKLAPVSSRGAISGQATVAHVIGSAFVVLGGLAFVLWALPGAQRAISSKAWIETPCTIVHGRVKEHRGDKGRTYSVDIAYRYTFGGKEFLSNAYEISPGSSSGRASKAKIVASYPEGSAQVCYVNPEDPNDAVLRRGWGFEWLLALVPVLFMGVGAAVFVASFRLGPRGQVKRDGPSESLVLESKLSPAMKFLAMLLGALAWNGLVSIFVVIAIRSFQAGEPEWTLNMILIPFVLVGLGLVVAMIHSALALANPRCHLRLTPPALTPGTTATVAWTTKGSTSRLQQLTLLLEGREEITYRSGKNTRRKKEIFASIPIAEIQGMLEMAQGQAQWKIPPGLPPGFDAPNNKIVWALKVHGVIPNWPDLDEEFGVTMLGEKS